MTTDGQMRDSNDMSDHDEIEGLVRIARLGLDPQATADAVARLATDVFEVRSCSVGRVRFEGGEHLLESLAASGDRSAFVRDAVRPLDDASEARAAFDGRPQFCGDPHGIAGTSASEGVGRWRDAIESHAHATLPLTGRDGVFGVLQLEWPGPQAFTAHDRTRIVRFADVAALVIEAADIAATESAPAPLPSGDHGELYLGAFRVSRAGLVLPAAPDARWDADVRLRVWTAVARGVAATSAHSFGNAVGTTTGALVSIVGTVRASQAVSPDLEVTLQRLARAAAAHGSAPAEVLGLLASAASADRDQVWVSAAVAELDVSNGALDLVAAGSVAVAFLGVDGRFELVAPDEAPLAGGRDVPAEPTRLLIPGDRIALLGGDTSSLRSALGVRRLEDALGGLGDAGGGEVARWLLATIRDEQAGASVVVIEVCDETCSEPAGDKEDASSQS